LVKYPHPKGSKNISRTCLLGHINGYPAISL
jgi:hypothetical protein